MCSNAKATGANDLSQLFVFDQETRLEDLQSHRVRYSTISGENTFALSIDESLAINQDQVAAYEQLRSSNQADDSVKPVYPIIPFKALLDCYGHEDIDSFVSPITNQPGAATKLTRFATFPPFLMMQVRRYVVGDNLQEKKVTAIVTVPEQLDLTHMRSTGVQPGEQLLSDDAPSAATQVASADIVAQIVAMDFSENAAKRAALATENVNAEVALEWLFAHMEDADINAPLPTTDAASSSSAAANVEVDTEALATMISFGISESHAKRALRETGGDIERAVDWAFNHEGL
jgi:ubiquitin carboxyl-terminal hydrolase 5/13